MKPFFLFSLVLLLGLSACRPIKEPVDPPVSTRGNIISTTLIRHYTLAQVDSIFAKKGINGFITAKNTVNLYKVVYKTVDWDGKETMASGLFVVPEGLSAPLDINCYSHGTIANKSDVPSNGTTDEVTIGIVMAGSLDYFVPLPDYLGLGESPGLHPYVHAKTEASAVIDIMRAGRLFCKEKAISLSGKVFLMGYSQGGHSAMAAQREIEANYSNEFALTAVAPLSGPYNISGVQADVIVKDNVYPSPGYLPYILLGYNQVYHLFNNPKEIMKDTFAAYIPAFFDGTHGIGEVDNAMPGIPNQIIRPEVLDSFRKDLNHRFRKALRDNDLIDWTPKTPMLMCACTGDKHVSYQNAMVAYYSFVNRGSTAVRPPQILNDYDHASCVFPSLLSAKEFFQTFR